MKHIIVYRRLDPENGQWTELVEKVDITGLNRFFNQTEKRKDVRILELT